MSTKNALYWTTERKNAFRGLSPESIRAVFDMWDRMETQVEHEEERERIVEIDLSAPRVADPWPPAWVGW